MLLLGASENVTVSAALLAVTVYGPGPRKYEAALNLSVGAKVTKRRRELATTVAVIGVPSGQVGPLRRLKVIEAAAGLFVTVHEAARNGTTC